MLLSLPVVHSCRIYIASNEVSPCSSPETPPSPLITAPPKPRRSWATLDDVVRRVSTPAAIEPVDADPSQVNASGGMLVIGERSHFVSLKDVGL